TKIERHAESEKQPGADDIAVADDHHVFVRVEPLQIKEGVDHAVLHLSPALATGYGRDAATAAPHLPAHVLADLISGQTRPVAEIELDHVVAILHRQGEPLRNDRRGLARALKWACINRIDFLRGQTFRDGSDFAAAFGREPDSGQTP